MARCAVVVLLFQTALAPITIRDQTDGVNSLRVVTVAAFCRRIGVSTVTFYAWKRRLRESPPAPSLVPESPSTRPMHEANGASTLAFLPVSIRDAGAAGQLEIELANACIVRLKGTVDPELLRIAIHAAGRLDGDGRGGE